MNRSPHARHAIAAEPEVIAEEVQQDRFTTRRRRRGKWVRFGLCSLLVLILTAGGYRYWYTHRPQPPNTERELFPGIHYSRVARQEPRPLVLHIVKVALDRPGISLLVTPGDPKQARPLRARTTAQFLQEFKLQLAVNGDSFSPWWSRTLWDYHPHVGDLVTPKGPAMSAGVIYSSGIAGWKYAVLSFNRKKQGVFQRIPPDAYNVICGLGMLLENGAVSARLLSKKDDLEPRTAVALDRDGRTLILLVIDGRQPNYSEGTTERETAEILREYGGYHAMNLDGGGSTTLVTADKNGKPSVLNCPIDNRIPGRERPVGNHLGIYVTPVSVH